MPIYTRDQNRKITGLEGPTGDKRDSRFTGVLRLGLTLCQKQQPEQCGYGTGTSERSQGLSLIDRLRKTSGSLRREVHSRQEPTRFRMEATLKLPGGESLHCSTRYSFFFSRGSWQYRLGV